MKPDADGTGWEQRLSHASSNQGDNMWKKTMWKKTMWKKTMWKKTMWKKTMWKKTMWKKTSLPQTKLDPSRTASRHFIDIQCIKSIPL
ncbi:hypothetical protein ACOMHN_053152 [Nucella lapillus]